MVRSALHAKNVHATNDRVMIALVKIDHVMIALGQTDQETTVREMTVRASEKARIRVPVRKAIARVSIATSPVPKAIARVSIGPAHRTTRIAPAPANGQADPMAIVRVPAATVRASIRIVPARTVIVRSVPPGIARFALRVIVHSDPPAIDPRVPVVTARFAPQATAPVSIVHARPAIGPHVPKGIVRVQPAIVPRGLPAVVAVPGAVVSARARIAAVVPVRPAVSVPSLAARANLSTA